MTSHSPSGASMHSSETCGWSRRDFVAASVAMCAVSAGAQSRPPLFTLARIVIGVPPGGTVDALARRTADKLHGSYAKTVVVENKPGAGGQIAMTGFKDGPADGSVLLLTPASVISVYPSTYRKLPYRNEEFSAVSHGAWGDFGVAIGPAVPSSVTSLVELAVWLNANPIKASMGYPGTGGMTHLLGSLLGRKLQVNDLNLVAYRGTVPGVQDLLGGQISSFCGPIGDYLPHLAASRLRVLAVSGRARSKLLPSVPTLMEQKVAMVARDWYGFFLPSRASAEVVKHASGHVQAALSHADLRDGMAQLGMEVQSSTPAMLAELVQADTQKWSRLVKEVGFTPES